MMPLSFFNFFALSDEIKKLSQINFGFGNGYLVRQNSSLYLPKQTACSKKSS